MSNETKQDNKTLENKKGTDRKRMTREMRRTLMTLGKQHIDSEILDSNFVYRLVNDKRGRVSQLERLGYEIVNDDGGKVIERPSNITDKEASSTRAVLMRIPVEDYKEIQALKKEFSKELKESLKPNTKDGQYGPGLVQTQERITR